jgi:hypothetical protein
MQKLKRDYSLFINKIFILSPLKVNALKNKNNNSELVQLVIINKNPN